MERNSEEKICFTLSSYVKDRKLQLVIMALTLFCLAVVLFVLGLKVQPVIFACLVVSIGFFLVFVMDYLRKKRYYDNLVEASDSLEHARHLSAFLNKPEFLEGVLSWESLDSLATISGDELAEAKEAAQAYNEYVNMWVHEIKTPLAASKLILARMKGPDATALRQEAESIERQIEQILYYTRSASLSQDYSIRESNLLQVVQESCKRNQNLMISSGLRPVLAVEESLEVNIDKSWFGFVLSQIIANSAKYGARELRFTSYVHGEGTQGIVVLEIADNGQGIPAEDMPRIFQRGFVGTNGRAEGSATGMGLYLCASLCEAMGLAIEVFSEEGKGTRVVISIPHNHSQLNLTDMQG